MKNNFSVRGKFFLYMYPTYKQRTGFTIHHSLSWSQDSSVSIMTTLQTGEPEFDFWKGQGIFLSLHPDQLWVLLSLLCNRYWGLFPLEYSGQGMDLTTHLNLVLPLGMHGATIPLPRMSS